MGSTAARRRRAGGARAGARLAAVLAAGALGACAGATDLVPPGSLPDKNCGNLAESECMASATCFWNQASKKCGPFVLPCSQYETPSECQARSGCKGIMVPRCLPASRPTPIPAQGCQGLKKSKCISYTTCNWNVARKYAFGQPYACTDKDPNLYKNVIVVTDNDGILDSLNMTYLDKLKNNSTVVVNKLGNNNDVVYDSKGGVADVSVVSLDGDSNKVKLNKNDVDDVGDITVVSIKGNNNTVTIEEVVGGCASLQKKKMCNSNYACRFTKVFHCVSREQIAPPTCDCSKEGSICDACYNL